MIYSPETFWREANPHAAENKEAFQLIPPYIELETGDAARWTPFLSAFSADNVNKDQQKPSMDNNTDLPSSVLNEGVKVQYRSENETNPDSYSEKRVVECSSTDLSKGMTEQDTCVDEAESFRSCDNDQLAGLSLEGCLSNDVRSSGNVDSLIHLQEDESSNTETVAMVNDERTTATMISSQICSSTTEASADKIEPLQFSSKKKKDHEEDDESSKARSIVYTEPISQPGSVSMRSDGSISNRSFAFPVLQSEWNSSPVKMVKADRQHVRRRKGLRFGFFCCRF